MKVKEEGQEKKENEGAEGEKAEEGAVAVSREVRID